MNPQLAFDMGELLFRGHSIDQFRTEPYKLISAILPNIFIFAGLILFLYLVFGGFIMLTGGGNPKNLDQGKSIITNAIIGFVIIFTSYWLIQIIQIISGIPILNPNL